MTYVEVFSRCLIGVVFLLSAWSKLPVADRFRQFAGSLAAMRLLPERLVGPVAAGVVAAEAAVPLLLLPLPVRALAVAGFALAAVLLLGFAVAIVAVLRRGVQASCRCFGGSREARFRPHHVVRNLVLVAVAGLGLGAALLQPSVPWQVLALAVPPAFIAAVLVTHLDDVVDLFAPAAGPARPAAPR